MLNRKKTYTKKLIRDKIPEIIGEKGAKFETRILKDKEFEKELKKKLVEEAMEVEKEEVDILNELADVLELIISIGELKGVEFKEIKDKQEEKKVERGGFSKKLFLEWVEEN